MERSIPRPTARRLNLYWRELQLMIRAGRTMVSSRDLGLHAGVTSAQVRKDLAWVARGDGAQGRGRAGIGYECATLLRRIDRLVGPRRTLSLALVGVGNIGRALLSYKAFDTDGYSVAAAFDASAAVVGKRVGRWTVRPMSQLARTVRDQRIAIGIVAVPRDAAQEVADQLCAAGVIGILNFAPMQLTARPNVTVTNIDLTIALKQLSMDIAEAQRDATRERA